MSDRWWIMFVQATAPGVALGPILIEPIHGSRIGARLSELARNNAYETFMIGLVASVTPEESARAIRAQYAGKNLHHDWYEPTADLLAYIQHVAQGPIKQLLALTHPGALSTETVGLEEMAKILDVHPKTVSRMVAAGEIPAMRTGRVFRFVPAEVFAALQHRVDGRR